MSNDLFRLVHPVSEQGLVEALRDPHLLEVKPVDAEVDLSGFDAALEQLLNSDVRESAMDGALVEPLHRALRHLPESVTTDMRVWHWFCLVSSGSDLETMEGKCTRRSRGRLCQRERAPSGAGSAFSGYCFDQWSCSKHLRPSLFCCAETDRARR